MPESESTSIEDLEDPASWLAAQSRLLSLARRSRNPAWESYDEALRVAQQARQPLWRRGISVLGELALFGMGAAAGLLIQFTTSDDPVRTRDWVVLLSIAVPCSVVYALHAYERLLR